MHLLREVSRRQLKLVSLMLRCRGAQIQVALTAKVAVCCTQALHICTAEHFI